MGWFLFDLSWIFTAGAYRKFPNVLFSVTHAPDSSEYLVPDLLEPGLKLVFCGTAPSRISARARAYYANPQNRFWRTLLEVGLTPRLLEAHEYPRLLEFGIGLTDVVKRHSGVDSSLPVGAFAPLELRLKLRTYRPLMLAFTSKRAASEVLEILTGRLEYGLQTLRLEDTALWVLPSTSPLGANHFRLTPWLELAQWFEAALLTGPETGVQSVTTL